MLLDNKPPDLGWSNFKAAAGLGRFGKISLRLVFGELCGHQSASAAAGFVNSASGVASGILVLPSTEIERLREWVVAQNPKLVKHSLAVPNLRRPAVRLRGIQDQSLRSEVIRPREA